MLNYPVDKIILSICIMTYNQPEEIERALRSIVPQLVPGVEVFIRDDSSDNKTEEIVKKYLSDNTIRYHKGEKIGIDGAVLFLTEQAKGDYVWWFGDDAMDKGAIKKVLNTLKQYPDISFIFINCRKFDDYKPFYQLGQDKFFKDNNQILEEIGTSGLGFVSSTLFKREKALSGIEQSKKYMGSAYINMFLIFHIISQKGKYYFLSKPYVVNYPATTEQITAIVKKDGVIKNNAFQVFGVNAFNIVSEFKDKFNKQSVRRMIAANFAFLWRGILVAWIGGWDTPKGKRWKMFKLYWSFPEFWVALPFFLLPLSVNKFFYRVYRTFFNHRQWRFGK